MPLTLNGTTGIAGVDGSAGTPATKGSDTDTGIVYGTNTVQIATNGATAVTVDGSQQVGIGTSSPSSILHVNGTGSVVRPYVTATTGFVDWQVSSTGGNLYLGIDNSAGGISGTAYGRHIYSDGSYPLDFYTNSAFAARIDSSGNLLVGTNAIAGTGWSGSVQAVGFVSHAGTTGSYSGNRFNVYWSGSNAQLWIDTVNQGNIAYSSDYRIKKDVVTQTQSAIDRINKLRSVTYTYADNGALGWKADGIIREGFIAHEVQSVIPSGAEGAKDEPDRVQNLRLDAILSVAVKAIQELSAKLDAAEARIAALEAK